jgi:hypothetical protein
MRFWVYMGTETHEVSADSVDAVCRKVARRLEQAPWNQQDGNVLWYVFDASGDILRFHRGGHTDTDILLGTAMCLKDQNAPVDSIESIEAHLLRRLCSWERMAFALLQERASCWEDLSDILWVAAMTES